VAEKTTKAPPAPRAVTQVRPTAIGTTKPHLRVRCVCVSVFLISTPPPPRASGAGVVAPEIQPLREDRGKVEERGPSTARASENCVRPRRVSGQGGKQLKQQGAPRSSGAGRFI
jgi:hypothetical protein